MLEITNHGYLELYDSDGNLVSRHTDPKEVYESASGQPPGTYTLRGRNQTIVVTGQVVPDPEPDPGPIPDPDPGPIPDPGTGPYQIQGPIPTGWASRINWPTAPTIGNTVTVGPSELSGALRNGADITLRDGTYDYVYLNSSTTDVILRAQNTGRAIIRSLRVDGRRIRLEGIRVDGYSDFTQGPRDVLVHNCHMTFGSGTQPTVYIGNGFQRVAFVRSTIINTADSWPFLYAGGDGTISQDFILAGSYVHATTGQANNDALRMGHTSRMIIVDNWIHSVTSANQFRMHAEIEDILLSNNVLLEGATKLFIDVNGSGVPGGYARRFYAIENRFYDRTLNQAESGPFTAMSNQGSVTDAHAVGNRQYSQNQPAGEMERGPTPWVTFQDNSVQAYQNPPTRTVGASH